MKEPSPGRRAGVRVRMNNSRVKTWLHFKTLPHMLPMLEQGLIIENKHYNSCESDTMISAT